MAKKIAAWVLGVLAVLLCLALAAVYIWGPSVGAMVTGKPIFIGPVSVNRYAASVIDISQGMGIHGDSPEAEQAASRVKEHAQYVDEPEAMADSLDALAKAAGGRHSNYKSASKVKEVEEAASPAPSVTREGKILIAKVPTIGWKEDGQGYADTLATGLLDKPKDTCGVIVDLRGNGGGDVGPMLAGVSPLLPDGSAMEWVGKNTNQVIISGNGVTGGGTPVIANAEGKLDVPVAVLIDKHTASSAEATAMAFHGLNARSFGQPTAGYTTANMVILMPDGAELAITIASDRDREGRTYEGDPIQPDEETSNPEAAARAWLGC